MRLLHLTTYLQGGAGRIICELACEQKRRGHQVSLATSKTEYPGYCNYPEYLSAMQKAEVPCHLVDSFFKRDEMSFARSKALVATLIENDIPDVIHCHASMPALAALETVNDKSLSIPIIQTMQGWGTNKTSEQIRQDVGTMNRLSKVTTVSHASKKLLISLGVSDSNLTVIPNFVSPRETAHVDDEDFEELKRMRESRKIIGCIGSLCARKNQKLLIEALALLDDSLDPFSLVLIGEGDEEGSLRRLAEENRSQHDVLFLGYKQKADRYLELFDLFILPSLAEGLPLSIIEAFRDRTPVLCSDIPENAELVQHGKTGFLFENANSKSCAATIHEALSLDSKILNSTTVNAHHFFEDNYTLARVNEAYLSLYNSLESNRQPPHLHSG